LDADHHLIAGGDRVGHIAIDKLIERGEIVADDGFHGVSSVWVPGPDRGPAGLGGSLGRPAVPSKRRYGMTQRQSRAAGAYLAFGKADHRARVRPT
ncbi:hypothetical protein RZS08_37750, partial [Arthrospira platensis SPKY1]|nr:hypothetical protein [Arthrospira platensis SPKY1]